MSVEVLRNASAGRRCGVLALLGLALLVSGCPNPVVEVREPTSARPFVRPQEPVPSGAIYRDTSYRPLFEDRRARFVGDTLTIQLNEKLNAEKKGASSAERTGSIAAAAAVVGIPLVDQLDGRRIDASSANKFSGKGETGASNVFTGTITVTVVEVLPNGNLVVSGEKQIGISKNSETLRFSGVVNPATVLPNNVVSSTQVADARIDYRSEGYVDEAQIMGWLARFFLTFIPF
jgi:flagellar L-ring protein precursor FlgH